MTNQELEDRELQEIANIIKCADVSDNIEDIDIDELSYNLQENDELISIIHAQDELGIVF